MSALCLSVLRPLVLGELLTLADHLPLPLTEHQEEFQVDPLTDLQLCCRQATSMHHGALNMQPHTITLFQVSTLAPVGFLC